MFLSIYLYSALYLHLFILLLPVSSEKIEALKNHTEDTAAQSTAIADKVTAIKGDIGSNLWPKLEEIQDFGLDGIVKANASGRYSFAVVL